MMRLVTSSSFAILLLASCGTDQRMQSSSQGSSPSDDAPSTEADVAPTTQGSVAPTTIGIDASSTTGVSDSGEVDPQFAEEYTTNLRGSLMIIGDGDTAIGCRVVTESVVPGCSGGSGVRLDLTRKDLEAAGVGVSEISKETGTWMSDTRVDIVLAPPFTFVPTFGLSVGAVVQITPGADDAEGDPFRPQETIQGTGYLAQGAGDSEDVEKARTDLQHALSPFGTVFIVDNATHFLVVTMLPPAGESVQLLVDSLMGEIRITSLLTQ